MNPLLPLFGVLLGWLLTEFSHSSRSRAETRRRLGGALSNLLSLWRQVKINYEYPRLLLAAPNLPESFRAAVKKWSQKSAEESNKVQEGLDESIQALAELDPVLAYKIRLWIGFKPVPWLSEANQPEETEELEEFHGKEISDLPEWKEFEHFILRLARRHGVRTWLRVLRQLKEPLIQEVLIDRLVKSFSRLDAIHEQKRRGQEWLRNL